MNPLLATSSIDQAPKLTPSYEIRERIETRINKDFDPSTADSRQDLLTRVRVGADYKCDKFTARLQYQFTHTASWTATRNFSDELGVVNQAWVKLPAASGHLTIGRQRLTLGNQRLIGSPNWSNGARAMDGVTYEDKGWNASAFRFVMSTKPLPNVFVAFASRAIPGGSMGYFYKTDRVGDAETRLHTLNLVQSGMFQGTQYYFEGAGQVGNIGAKAQSAFALHAALSRKVCPKLTAGVEYSLATGGGSANRSNTFDPLYPSSGVNGVLEITGSRNLSMFTGKVELNVTPESSARFTVRRLFLFDSKDGWYSTSGSLNAGSGGPFIDPNGNSGRDIGVELDFDYTWNFKRIGSLTGGMSLFKPGGFIGAVTDGPVRDLQWFYLMFQAKF